MAVRLADAVVFFKTDDKELKSGFNKAEAETTSWTSRIGGVVGKALTGVVVGAAVAATTAVVGIGKAAFDVSADTRAAANDMAASLGVPKEEARKFAEVAKNIFGNNFAKDVQDAGLAIAEVARQMKLAADDPSLQQISEKAIALRDNFDVELVEGVSTVKTLMEQFGLTSQQAFDFLAAGFQRGLNGSDDFTDTINEYSGVFRDAGGNAEEFFSLLETGYQAGTLGTDAIADGFKEFSLRILDGSKKTKNALEGIGLDAEKLTGQIENGSLTIEDAFGIVIQAIDDTASKAERGAAITDLLGTRLEDLGESATLGVDTAKTKMSELEGASDNLNSKYQNLGDLASGMWRKFIVGLTPVTDKLLELAIERMPQVEKAVGQLMPIIENFAVNVLVPLVDQIFKWIDGFANLSPETQNMITLATGLVAGFIAVGAVLGPLIGVFSAVTGVITTVGGAILTLLGGPITIAIAAIAAFALAYKTNFLGIKDITDTTLAHLGALMTSFWTGIKSIWTTTTQFLKTSITMFWIGVKNLWTTSSTTIQNASSTAWTTIKTTVTTIASSMVTTLGSHFASLLIKVVSAFGSIRSSISNAFNFNWSSIGSNIVSGIAGGISAGSWQIASAARSAASNALQAAKNLLGIQSPSRVFERDVGMPITQGIARGIRRGTPEVTAELRRNLDALINVNVPQLASAQAARSIGPVSITQYITGPVDRNILDESNNRLREALRQSGVVV
ncbi:MAG: phage tail tape measure protein [Chloroflexota bacterium]